jgi:hypothetical protein
MQTDQTNKKMHILIFFFFANKDKNNSKTNSAICHYNNNERCIRVTEEVGEQIRSEADKAQEKRI